MVKADSCSSEVRLLIEGSRKAGHYDLKCSLISRDSKLYISSYAAVNIISQTPAKAIFTGLHDHAVPSVIYARHCVHNSTALVKPRAEWSVQLTEATGGVP